MPGSGDVDLNEATARPLRALPERADPNAKDVEPQTDPASVTAEVRLRSAMSAATEATQKRSVIAAQRSLAETRVAHLSREMAGCARTETRRLTGWQRRRWPTRTPRPRSRRPARPGRVTGQGRSVNGWPGKPRCAGAGIPARI